MEDLSRNVNWGSRKVYGKAYYIILIFLNIFSLISPKSKEIIEVRFHAERDIPSLGVRTGGWVEVDVSVVVAAVALGVGGQETADGQSVWLI